MPLNEGATSQVLPFAPEGTEAAGDLMTLADYQTHTNRLRGHQPGLAQRALENRALRQVSLIAAGLAQYIANRYAAGVIDDGDLDKIEAGVVAAIQAQIAASAPANASTTVRGIVELATTTETRALESGTLAVTPSGLGAALADALGSVPTDMLRRTVSTPDLAAGFYVTPAVLAIVDGVVTPDFASRNVMTLAVTAAVTLANPATIPAGGRALIIATQDATGRALTLGSAYRIAGGEWSADPGVVNFLDLTFGGGGGLIDVDISQRGEA
jgi:hypothetical protein